MAVLNKDGKIYTGGDFLYNEFIECKAIPAVWQPSLLTPLSAHPGCLLPQGKSPPVHPKEQPRWPVAKSPSPEILEDEVDA